MSETTLTVSELRTLSELQHITDTRSRVRWLPFTDSSTVADGVARNLTTADGNHWHDSDGDVRDAYVWISGMTERFLPVREVLAMMRSGTFAADSTH